jgi:outer membrane protein assembly factor BamC
VTRSCFRRHGALAIALCGALAGCSSVENFASGDRIDYKAAPAKAAPLDVPPDLTQLARDSRYQAQGGTVSAATYQTAAAAPRAAKPAPLVAPQSLAGMRIERQGNQRWLSTPLTPEQLWPQIQAFWKEIGLTLVVDDAAVGVMETDWQENRAKLPDDIFRRALGRLVDSIYSTGERDKFRTRLERSGGGTEVFISHRGLIEVYTGRQTETTVWQRRPNDPELEAIFLARLMVKLGADEEKAKALAASDAPAAPTRARLLDSRPAATLQVDDNFDRAWRRVGLALDRSGFTVEDRDRAQGLYFVRYIDPALAGQEEPGFFARLFGADKSDTGPKRFRIAVRGEGAYSAVSVLNTLGAPDNGDVAKRIIAVLLEELK